MEVIRRMRRARRSFTRDEISAFGVTSAFLDTLISYGVLIKNTRDGRYRPRRLMRRMLSRESA